MGYIVIIGAGTLHRKERIIEMKKLKPCTHARFTLEEIKPQGAFCIKGVYNFEEAKEKLAENKNLRIYGAGDRREFELMKAF